MTGPSDKALEAAVTATFPPGVGTRRGAVLAAYPVIREDVLAEVIHDDGPQGMRYVWVCPKCGQPLGGEGGRCNSGVHEGPDADYEARPTAVRSIDARESALREAVTALRAKATGIGMSGVKGDSYDGAANLIERELLP